MVESCSFLYYSLSIAQFTNKTKRLSSKKNFSRKNRTLAINRLLYSECRHCKLMYIIHHTCHRKFFIVRFRLNMFGTRSTYSHETCANKAAETFFSRRRNKKLFITQIHLCVRSVSYDYVTFLFRTSSNKFFFKFSKIEFNERKMLTKQQ